MGAAPSHSDYHLVAFGDYVVNRGFEIWEGAAKHDGHLFDALTTRRDSGWEFFSFNEVGRDELVDQTHVSLIEDFLHHSTKYRLVLFCWH